MNNEPGYRPFCLMCDTMGRMTITPSGFRCDGEGDHFGRPGCGNEIDKEGKRLPGSAGPRRPYRHQQIDVYKALAAAIRDGRITLPPGTGKTVHPKD